MLSVSFTLFLIAYVFMSRINDDYDDKNCWMRLVVTEDARPPNYTSELESGVSRLLTAGVYRFNFAHNLPTSLPSSFESHVDHSRRRAPNHYHHHHHSQQQQQQQRKDEQRIKVHYCLRQGGWRFAFSFHWAVWKGYGWLFVNFLEGCRPWDKKQFVRLGFSIAERHTWCIKGHFGDVDIAGNDLDQDLDAGSSP